jgi:hypothetical protein
LVPLAPIRRGFPCLRELAVTMPEYERKWASVYRDLIKHISVITVKRLPLRSPFDGVVRAGGGDHSSTDCKTALLSDDQRLRLVVSGSYCTC